MYTEFFGLTEHPFELHTDSRFLYLSPAHARTQAFLMYAALKRDGIVAITGDIGAGKSTMIEDLRQNVDSGYRLLVLHQTQLDELELLKHFLLKLGVRDTTFGKAQTLSRIRRALIEGHNRGEKAVLIVDDSQNLSIAAIEELRMLADDECDGQHLLGLVLIGQPSLRQTLAGENLAQVRQRVRLHYQLDPLAPDQVRAYVAHRLAVAGCQRDDVFDTDALDLIAIYSRGLPRLINILCDMSLTGCALKQRQVVTARSVCEALHELGWSRPMPASGLRRGFGEVALLGAAEAFDQLRNATGNKASWADGARRPPAALARLGAHRQLRAWRGRAKNMQHRVVSSIGTARASTRHMLARAQVAAEKAASTPAGGGWMSDFRWAVGGFYLARRSIAVTLAMASLAVFVAMRLSTSPESALSASATTLATLEANVEQSAPPPSPVERTPADSKVEAASTAPAAPLQVASSVTKPQTRTRQRDAHADATDLLPNTNLPIRNADWLMSQRPDAYTIQIIGARNTRNLARFVRNNDLAEDLAYFSIPRNGEDFYLLLHGVYRDATAAADARGGMPSGVQAGKPWIRSFADIQASIREARATRRVALVEQPSAISR